MTTEMLGVMIPVKLKTKLIRLAKRRDLTLSQLVRRQLQHTK
jgi:hypothetical protein